MKTTTHTIHRDEHGQATASGNSCHLCRHGIANDCRGTTDCSKGHELAESRNGQEAVKAILLPWKCGEYCPKAPKAKRLIRMPKGDTGGDTPFLEMPFWKWLNEHKETPSHFVEAVAEYLGMDRTTQRLDPAEMETAKHTFEHFWWVKTRPAAKKLAKLRDLQEVKPFRSGHIRNGGTTTIVDIYRPHHR